MNTISALELLALSPFLQKWLYCPKTIIANIRVKVFDFHNPTLEGSQDMETDMMGLELDFPHLLPPSTISPRTEWYVLSGEEGQSGDLTGSRTCKKGSCAEERGWQDIQMKAGAPVMEECILRSPREPWRGNTSMRHQEGVGLRQPPWVNRMVSCSWEWSKGAGLGSINFLLPNTAWEHTFLSSQEGHESWEFC